jgi:arylsulfatase
MEHTLPFILQFDESLDIGSDTGTPVDDNDYSTPFTFTGKLNKITLNIDRPKLSPEDIKRLQAAARAAGDGPSADAETAPTGGTAPQVSGDIGLNLAQKVELRIDKLEGCRKQAKGLGLVERVQFVRKCME